jgi:hypothetical protein
LINKFKLLLNDKTVKELTRAELLPDAPIKTMEIELKGGHSAVQRSIMIVDKYRTTIENMTLTKLSISYDEMELLLKNMDNLQTLKFQDVELTSDRIRQIKLPALKSLLIVYSKCSVNSENEHYNTAEEIMGAFMHNRSVERFQYSQKFDGCRSGPHIKVSFFQHFLETLPNVRHLVLEGYKVDNLLRMLLPHPLESLQSSLDFHTSAAFLSNQKGSLKELRLRDLPLFFGSSAVLSKIYDMNLKNFYLGGIPLILNYQTQHVEQKLAINYMAFETFLEILKRGRCKCD